MAIESPISTNSEYFPNPLNGKPLSNGYLYVGTQDLDPAIEANRVTVTVIQEDGTRVPILPAIQPLTIFNGRVYFGGQFVVAVADDTVSVKITDKKGVQLGYYPRTNNYPLADDLASTANGKGASLVAVEDAQGMYVGENVESVLAEIKTKPYTNKAEAIQYDPVNDAMYFIGGTDGGWHKGVTGAAPGTYSDNAPGSPGYCGTVFIPTGGDGSKAYLRVDGGYNVGLGYQPGWFGALGDGSTDDTVALNLMLLAAAGKVVNWGSQTDTYIVTESYSGIGASAQTYYGALKVYSNTLHQGNATIKVKDNTSTSGTPRDVSIFLVTENEMSVTGIEMQHLVLDCNGANNLISASHDGRLAFAGFYVTGDDVVITDSVFYRVKFKNTPGVTSLGLGQSNNFTTATMISNNVDVLFCEFDDNGTDTDDHSSIYGWCEDLHIFGCHFNRTVDDTAFVNPAAWEIHGARTITSGNTIEGFYSKAAFISVNYVNDVTDVIVENNIANVYRSGFDLFKNNANFKNLSRVQINKNIINISDKADTAGVTTAGVKINPLYGCTDISCDGNDITAAGLAHKCFGYYIVNGTADYPIDDVKITGGKVKNATKGVFGETSAGVSKIGLVQVHNVTVINPTDSDDGTQNAGIDFNGDAANNIGKAIITANTIIDKRVAAGTHDGLNDVAVLSDSTATFTINELIGGTLTNITDGSSGVITANTEITITATLTGGTDNDWDATDSYTVSPVARSGVKVKDVHTLGLDDNIYVDLIADTNIDRSGITEFVGDDAQKTIVTTAELSAKANEINTKGKYIGKMVMNTTTQKPMWAWGTSDVAPWKDAQAAGDIVPS